MTKFETITQARESSKARHAQCVVEFADGSFGLSKQILDVVRDFALMEKNQIIAVHPKTTFSSPARTGISPDASTLEGKAEAQWEREERPSRIH